MQKEINAISDLSSDTDGAPTFNCFVLVHGGFDSSGQRIADLADKVLPVELA